MTDLPTTDFAHITGTAEAYKDPATGLIRHRMVNVAWHGDKRAPVKISRLLLAHWEKNLGGLEALPWGLREIARDDTHAIFMREDL